MMKKGIFRFAAAVAAVLTAAAAVWAAPLSKKRATAVLLYDIDSSNRYSSATVWDYYGGVSVSRGGAYAQGAALATEMIREQLLRNGYKVVSDQITARLIKAQSKPAGAVTKYETTNTGGAAGAILGGYRGGLLSGLANTNTAYVTLDVRIVDTTSGAIVYAGRAEGAATDVLGGLVSRYGGFGSGRSGGQLATATHKAVTKVVNNLREAVGAGAAPGSGGSNYVLENRAGSVTIDAGSTTAGARRGQFYAVFREGAPIRDLHGNVLDAERDYIAVIQITDARPQYSKAKIIRGRGVRRGDGIELIRKPDQVRLIGE